ncbi:MAG: hypothetical protein RLZZ491_116 [Pseudomonadota bacterium]
MIRPLARGLTLAVLLVASISFFAARPMSAQTAPAQPAPAAESPGSAQGPVSAELHVLLQAMGIYEVLNIMAAEGLAGAPDLEADLFAGKGGSAWLAMAASIYDGDRMVSRFEAAFPAERLSAEQIATLAAFFDSELGQRIAAGETAARRAFLDTTIEDAASELAQRRAADGHPRIAQLTRFIAVNDLVERNVSGALNSNFAFYRALSDAGAFPAPIPEAMMLAEVWGQEPEIRADTLEWLFGFQTLAYEDLSDADLEAYIAISETPAGQALNAALFVGFDALFEAISADLGRAAAGFIAGEDT